MSDASPCVYEDRFFQIVAPEFPLNCREDGGHLVVVKKEPVTDRSDLTWQEAVRSCAFNGGGKAMYEVLGIERMNYEDLGNWGLDDPGGAKMHLHLFGRSREQISSDSRTTHLLYPKDHPIYKGHLKPLGDDDLSRLRAHIAEILAEPKYEKMAQLAEL